MEASSSRKHPNLDPEPNSSLTKRRSNNSKSLKDIKTQSLQIELEKNINILKGLEIILTTEELN